LRCIFYLIYLVKVIKYQFFNKYYFFINTYYIMALRLRPDQLVVDHIYHRVHGTYGANVVYGRRNLMFTRRMGDNLLFTTFNEAGRLENVSIPITPGLTFTERTDEDEDLPNGNDTPSSESDEEDPDPGPDDIYLHGMAAPAAAAAGRDLMRKSKRKGKSKKRKGMSKKRRSRKSRKMRKRRVTVF
jgi:hypothetical protein